MNVCHVLTKGSTAENGTLLSILSESSIMSEFVGGRRLSVRNKNRVNTKEVTNKKKDVVAGKNKVVDSSASAPIAACARAPIAAAGGAMNQAAEKKRTKKGRAMPAAKEVIDLMTPPPKKTSACGSKKTATSNNSSPYTNNIKLDLAQEITEGIAVIDLTDDISSPALIDLTGDDVQKTNNKKHAGGGQDNVNASVEKAVSFAQKHIKIETNDSLDSGESSVASMESDL